MTKYILLTNALLIDGTGSEPISNSSVLICDNKIKAVSPDLSSIPENCQLIDLNGCAILPGLIDNHVHVVITDQLAPVFLGRKNTGNSFIHAIEIERALKKTLDAGFTTVRDAGMAGKEIKVAIEEGIVDGPRLIISSAILTQTGGHADSRKSLNSVNGLDWIGVSAGSIVCDGVDNVIKATREQIKAGADWIKVMAGGGVMSPDDKLDSSQYNISELKAIVETAAASAIPVFAHCHSVESIKNCILAGIKCIEHGTFITDELVDLMEKHECHLVPTLYVVSNIDLDNLPMNQKAKVETVLPIYKKSLSRAFESKNRILIGSGTDCFGDKDAGLNGWELTYKVELGYTPMEAIVSATKINAEILGLENEIGTIEINKIADIIVIDGNPVENIHLLQGPDNVKMVMKEGRIIKNTLI